MLSIFSDILLKFEILGKALVDFCMDIFLNDISDDYENDNLLTCFVDNDFYSFSSFEPPLTIYSDSFPDECLFNRRFYFDDFADSN